MISLRNCHVGELVGAAVDVWENMLSITTYVVEIIIIISLLLVDLQTNNIVIVSTY
jgi:hypothetical protein